MNFLTNVTHNPIIKLVNETVKPFAELRHDL